MRRHNALKILVLIVLIVAVVPPAIFGTPRVVAGVVGGDTWRNFIFDFQTLIGGLFAVFAAWWTVDTMERTDRAAQKRHDHLMAQQTRPDALRVERYIKAEFPNLVDAVRVLEMNRIPVGLTAEEILTNFVTKARVVEGCLNWTSNFDSQTNWTACAQLFGGDLERDWQNYLTVARGASVAASAAWFYASPTNRTLKSPKEWEEVEQRDAEVRRTIESLPTQLERAIELLKRVRGHLEELGRVYGATYSD